MELNQSGMSGRITDSHSAIRQAVSNCLPYSWVAVFLGRLKKSLNLVNCSPSKGLRDVSDSKRLGMYPTWIFLGQTAVSGSTHGSMEMSPETHCDCERALLPPSEQAWARDQDKDWQSDSFYLKLLFRSVSLVISCIPGIILLRDHSITILDTWQLVAVWENRGCWCHTLQRTPQ